MKGGFKNKKMNKSFLIIAIVGIFAIGLSSALLVNYLSNQAEAEISVESPFEISVWNGEGWGESTTLDSVVGGDTFSLPARVKSLTSVDANVNVEMVITNDNGNPRCEDFSNIWINGSNSDIIEASPSNGDGVCVENHGAETVTMTIPAYYNAGEIEFYDTQWTFALNVEPATYNIDSQIVIQ